MVNMKNILVSVASGLALFASMGLVHANAAVKHVGGGPFTLQGQGTVYYEITAVSTMTGLSSLIGATEDANTAYAPVASLGSAPSPVSFTFSQSPEAFGHDVHGVMQWEVNGTAPTMLGLDNPYQGDTCTVAWTLGTDGQWTVDGQGTRATDGPNATRKITCEVDWTNQAPGSKAPGQLLVTIKDNGPIAEAKKHA